MTAPTCQNDNPIRHFGRTPLVAPVPPAILAESRWHGISLPRTVRGEGITADFDNGLLTVRLPKAEEAVSRKFEVARRN